VLLFSMTNSLPMFHTRSIALAELAEKYVQCRFNSSPFLLPLSHHLRKTIGSVYKSDGVG
jgi:hypothetical protein